MPMIGRRLGAMIEKEFSNTISRKFPGAKPKNQYMKKFTQAIGLGIVDTLRGASADITPTGGLGAVGIGVFGISATRIKKDIITRMVNYNGTKGKLTDDLARVISTAVTVELSQATVVGTAAGTVREFKGWTAQRMAQLMHKHSGFKKTEQNTLIWKVISESVTAEIMKSGRSNILPVGPGSGSKKAILT